MGGKNWLVCGTRKKGYDMLVWQTLNKLLCENIEKPDSIIEGCCPNSADEYAEEWAKENNIPIQHHPSTPGNYLKRNIEMISKCDLVIAFYDRYSYGTAQTIANAVMQNKPVIVIQIK